MKANIVNFRRSCAKHAIIVTVLLFSASVIAFSQESTTKSSALYPTFGIAIGFFYPDDVNNHIDEELSMYSSVNEDMYAYFDLRGGLTYRLKKVDFTAALEYSIAPKFAVNTTGGENYSFIFSRIAPEVSANYYIPISSGKNAFFIGGGISYNFLYFKSYKVSAPGFKVQAGYSFQFGKFNLQPYAAFRYTKGSDTSFSDQFSNNDFELNFTGGQIGVIVSFHNKILYK